MGVVTVLDMIHNFPRKVKDLSSDAASAPAGLESIREPIEEDLSAVDSVIRRRLESHVVLIRTIADYIVGAGGKRLRPFLLAGSRHSRCREGC